MNSQEYQVPDPTEFSALKLKLLQRELRNTQLLKESIRRITEAHRSELVKIDTEYLESVSLITSVLVLRSFI